MHVSRKLVQGYTSKKFLFRRNITQNVMCQKDLKKLKINGKLQGFISNIQTETANTNNTTPFFINKDFALLKKNIKTVSTQQ